MSQRFRRRGITVIKDGQPVPKVVSVSLFSEESARLTCVLSQKLPLTSTQDWKPGSVIYLIRDEASTTEQLGPHLLSEVPCEDVAFGVTRIKYLPGYREITADSLESGFSRPTVPKETVNSAVADLIEIMRGLQ